MGSSEKIKELHIKSKAFFKKRGSSNYSGDKI